MLKIIRRIIIIFLLGFNSLVVSGQLNGTYTIGNSGADYLTIQNAVTDLNNLGISGPVVFDIQPGSFNTSVTISPVTGSSPSNSITFKSQNNDSTSVELVGPDCFMIDPNVSNLFFSHLTLKVSWGAGQGRAIRISQNTSNIGINNCVFTGASGLSAANFENLSTNSKMTRTYIHLIGTTNLSVQNNVFGSNGAIMFKSGTGTTPINNINISNNKTEGYLGYGFHLYYTNNIICNANIFSGNVDKCIEVQNYSGNFELNSNQFSPGQINSVSIHADPNTSNNSIAAKNNFFPSYGLCLALTFIQDITLYNNSFNSENSSCLSIYTASPLTASIDLQNNVFSRLDINEACVYLPNIISLDSITSNNNAFTHDSLAFIITTFPSSQNTSYNLDEWVSYSSKDQSSIVVGPVFTDFIDLHTPNAFLLDGSAAPLITVSADIDQEARNVSTPDLGADEFTMDYATFLDIELVEILDPNLNCNSSDTLFISVANKCLTQIDSFKIVTSFDNVIEKTLSYYLTIIPGDTVIVAVPECLFRDNTLYENFYCRIIEPNGVLDNNQSNNSDELSDVFRLNDFDILKEDENYFDCPTQVLSVPEFPGSTINWSTGESIWSISINSNGTYSATVTSSNGCQIVESIIIN